MKILLRILFLLVSNPSAAQDLPNVNIIPQPAELKTGNGHFNLNRSTFIIANAAAKKEADLLNNYLKKFYGIKLDIRNISPYGPEAKNCIILGHLHPADKTP